MKCPFKRTLPDLISDSNGELVHLQVPCGKCYACLHNRTQDLITRLEMESSFYTFPPYFLTLTYSPESLHLNSSGIPSVCKRDMQLFFKSLRKYYYPVKFRYLMIGEYGGKTARPHYHAILFHDLSRDQLLDFSDIVRRIWKKGHVRVSVSNSRRIAYCAAYHVNKGYYPEGSDPGFSLPSRRPGLGAEYVDSGRSEIHFRSEFPVDGYMRSDGQIVPIPRYIKKRANPEPYSWPFSYDSIEYSDYLRTRYPSLFFDFDPSKAFVMAHKRYAKELSERHREMILKHGKLIIDG